MGRTPDTSRGSGAACKDEIELNALLLDMGFARLRFSLVMTLVMVAGFFGVMGPLLPDRLAELWAVLLALVSFARLGLWCAYRQRGRRRRKERAWQRLFVLGAVVGGGTWAFGAVALIPVLAGADRMLMPLTLLAVSAVSTSSLAPQPRAMVGMQLAMLGPTAAMLAAMGSYVDLVAAAVVLAAMLMFIAVGLASSAATRSLIGAELRVKRAMAVAEEARVRAEDASRAKTRFLASMSHELRTPLNAVIGAAQLIESGAQDANERAHLVDAIRRSGTNLLGLIENVLDLARIEAGEQHTRREDFHLVEALDAVLATAGLEARSKGLRLACIVDPALAAWRQGDASRFRQVLLNLLGNAVKFTTRGDVTVQVGAGAAGEAVRIAVSDTGAGIEPSQLPHIFEPFRQGDEGAGRRFGGSGLGLAIVRQVVAAMGGTIDVTSRPGEGSCFVVELPLPVVAAPPPEPAPLRQQVAFVEPHEPSAAALEALLLRMGCTPRRCRNVVEVREWAAAHARRAEARWVLLDADATATGAIVEASPEGLDPERLVLVSSRERHAAARARERRAGRRHIVKPISRAALVSALGGRPPGSPEPAGSGRDADALSAPQRAGVHVLVVEDDALNQTVVLGMLRHAGFRATTAGDGRAALTALAEGSFAVVLLDWHMPELDGTEVARRVRAGEAGEAARAVPIVALTANAFAEDRDLCLAAGMDDFLTKPVDAVRLVRTVDRWAQRAAEPLAPAAAPAASARDMVLDPSVLAALPMVADGSQPDYGAEVLAMFLGREEATLAAVQAGLDAGDRQRLRRELHTLKSAAATVGALALAALARTHEHALREGGDVPADVTVALREEFARLRRAVATCPAAAEARA